MGNSNRTPAAAVRNLADREGIDLDEARDLEALADEIRRQPNAAQCDCPHRQSVEWTTDGFSPLYDPALYRDWSDADKKGLAAIRHAVVGSLRQYFSASDIAWVTEEVLWQIRGLVVRGQTVRIPQLGDLALQLDGTLAASAVPGLAREDGGA